jgi:hypothetical protein
MDGVGAALAGDQVRAGGAVQPVRAGTTTDALIGLVGHADLDGLFGEKARFRRWRAG